MAVKGYSGKILDAHLHLDIMLARSEGVNEFFKQHRMGGIIWSFNEKVTELEDLARYFHKLDGLSREFQRDDTPIYYLVGIHPRCFTNEMARAKDLTRRLATIYAPFLSQKECLGIGEIGLERGTREEEIILRAQLELGPLAKEYGKKIGVHTPRKEKEKITRQSLDILKDYPSLQEDILVDHCTPRTIGMVLSAGFAAGVTMSPIKCQIEDLMSILERFQKETDRICLNTDAAQIYDSLIEVASCDQLESSLKEKLLWKNARRFWKIP